MMLKELLNHFSIDEEFPDYLLDESFNEVFLDGDLSKTDNDYKIKLKQLDKSLSPIQRYW